MKTFSIIIACITFYASAVLAQESLEFVTDPARNVAVAAEFVPAGQPADRLRFVPGTSATAPVAADPVVAASSFMSKWSQKFGARATSGLSAKILRSVGDDNGVTHVVFGQYYMGFPVIGGDINVNVDASGKVTGAIGRLARIVPFSPRKKIQNATAKALAIAAWKKVNQNRTPAATVYGPLVFVPQHLNPRLSRLSKLVWSVRLTFDDPPKDDIYLIDAATGAIVHKASGERQIDRRVDPIDRRVGDCTIVSVTGKCGNYDTWNAANTYRYGRREGYTPAGTNPTYGGTDVDDSFEYLLHLDAFLIARYGRYGLNGQGGSGNATNIPVGSYRIFNYLEAVSASNKPFCGTFQYSTIQLCAGAAIPDVIAHEAMHGLMLYQYGGDQSVGTGLSYYGQSGAIEESAADVMGADFEYYLSGLSGTPYTDWKLQKHRDIIHGFHRDSANPHSLSSVYGLYPDRIGDSGYYCGSGDSGGVHQNSTLLSHAVYLMANGGNFNGAHVNGIGMDRATKISLRAATSFATTSPTFVTAMNSFIQACQALYPRLSTSDPDLCNDVRVALYAAELDKTPCTGGTAPRTSTVSCRDNDGEDYLTAGSVTADGYVWNDSCRNKMAFEQTCLGPEGTRLQKMKMCVRGCAANGRACNP